MNVMNLRYVVLNEDDVIRACRLIIETCHLLDIPAHCMKQWVTDYIIEHSEIRVY